MRFVLDVPFSYLNANDEFEAKSKEFLSYWLNNYADGVRFLKSNEKSDKNDVSKWREHVNEISKKTLKEK